MTKSIIIGVVAVVIIGGGGYLIFHKSPTKTPAASSQSSNSSKSAAVNNAVVITKTDAKLGQYLADPSGNALYIYNSDSAGVSNCTGSCLANWPAYQDKGSTSNLPTDIGTIKRTDNGQTQYTYLGMPLYYFTSDGQGQVTGNGVESFSVAKPSATSSSQSTTTPSSSSTSSQSSSGSAGSSSSSGYNY